MSINAKSSFELNEEEEKLIKVSGMVIHTAQQTLSDLDRSIEELSLLVDKLKDSTRYLDK